MPENPSAVFFVLHLSHTVPVLFLMPYKFHNLSEPALAFFESLLFHKHPEFPSAFPDIIKTGAHAVHGYQANKTLPVLP